MLRGIPESRPFWSKPPWTARRDPEAIPICMRLELSKDETRSKDEIGFTKASSTMAAKQGDIIQCE